MSMTYKAKYIRTKSRYGSATDLLHHFIHIIDEKGVVVKRYGFFAERGYCKSEGRTYTTYSSDTFSHAPWRYIKEVKEWHLDYFLENDINNQDNQFVSLAEKKRRIMLRKGLKW